MNKDQATFNHLPRVRDTGAPSIDLEQRKQLRARRDATSRRVRLIKSSQRIGDTITVLMLLAGVVSLIVATWHWS